MTKLAALAAILSTGVLLFLAGTWVAGREAARGAATATSTGANGAGPAAAGVAAAEPGALALGAGRRQLIGVRVAAAEKRAVTHTLRLLGRVAADATRIYRVNAPADGWIQRAPPLTVGSLVRRGELLATFYNSQLLDAQQTYLYALSGLGERGQPIRRDTGRQIPSNQGALSDITLQRQIDVLRGLGMGEAQIQELARTRTLMEEVRLTAPAAGVVTARNVSAGQRFLKGESLYEVTDMSRVWIVADLFESEARFAAAGRRATVQQPHLALTLTAVVSRVPPVFNLESRTIQVRLEAENPGLALRPGMFVDVELPLTLDSALVVPAEALFWSGRRRIVFVEPEEGVFTARQVETGWRLGDLVEITSGLAPGERIVISGGFLIDSESRLQAAAQGLFGAVSVDPACGAEVDELKARAAGLTSDHQGRTYFFSSRECLELFEGAPDRFVPMPPASQ